MTKYFCFSLHGWPPSIHTPSHVDTSYDCVKQNSKEQMMREIKCRVIFINFIGDFLYYKTSVDASGMQISMSIIQVSMRQRL